MHPLQTIDNFIEIADWLSTAGQPKVEEFALIKTEGFTTVINLALSTSTNALVNESEIVEALGMEYVHIPVAWENPTSEDFQKFAQKLAKTLNHSLGSKVFVHCAMNMRVSAFVYLYRRIYQHITHDVAVRDLEKIWTPNPIWQKFIEHIIETKTIKLPSVPAQIYSFADLSFPTDGIRFEYESQVYTRPYIIFNMVSSVDGKATTKHGELTGLGSRMDRKIMNRLRSQVDAVIVGGETLRADPFIPTVPPELLEERLQNFSGQPLGLVISNSGNLPLDHRFWLAGKDLRIVFLGAAASLETEALIAEKAQVFRLSEQGIAGMLDCLWQQLGVKTLMVEGGANVNYQFISQGWGDELFLTLSPKLVGGIKNTSIIGGADYGMSDMLGGLPDLKLRSLYHHDHELYLRYKIEIGSS